MVSPRSIAAARRALDRVRRGLGEDVRRLREDAGLTMAALSEASGVDATFLAQLEAGLENPSLLTYARLGTALGADLNAHLYPNTGPAIRDRHQARILEWLLAQLHPRWSAHTEVAVRQPARGWIDAVLHDRRAECVVATEIQSGLPRIEQLVRWSGEKAASLPSWEGFGHLGPVSTVSKLLLVRSSRATRAIARQFAGQLQTAFPAHPEDAIAALVGTRPWPGAALVWVDLRAGEAGFISHR